MPIAVDAFCYGAVPKVTAYFLTWVCRVCTLTWQTCTRGPLHCSVEELAARADILFRDDGEPHRSQARSREALGRELRG